MKSKKIHYFILISILFSFQGCKLEDKAKNQYERYKHKYEEYMDKPKRGKRPFRIHFQENEQAKTTIISAQCTANHVPQYIYFPTQEEAHNHIFESLKNLYTSPPSGILKPFWDVRYTNPMTQYISGNTAPHYANHSKLTGLDSRSGVRNITVGTHASQTDLAGSVVQSKCVNGIITAGTTLNLNDAPTQSLQYAGIASTFSYSIHQDTHIYPWKEGASGNLLLQAYYDTPIYRNFAQNIGASLAYNVFLYNRKIKKHLNYVIGIYAVGEAWKKEKAGIRYDPTTNVIHVATVIKDSSWWSTKSPKSDSIIEILNSPTKTTKDDEKWKHFYRVNIAYNNLLEVLREVKRNPPAEVAGQDFGLRPQDWEITLLAIQYEIEEQGGKALFSGSFSGFEAYITDNPL